MASENYVLLERTELNAAAASVTFANIPQTGYTDLKIVVSARLASGTGFMLLDFNGLSTANFSHRVLEGNGASAYSFVSGNTNYATGLVGGGDTANTFTNVEFYIPNYAGSTFKSVSIDGVTENNGTTAYADLEALLWSNTAAISQFKLTTSSAVNFAVGSTFSLYGLAALGTTPAIAPKADGGNVIATDGTYWIHTFTSSGVFTPQTGLTCDYLVVAGGGGGGANDAGGGGGAGGLRSTVTATGGGGSLESALVLLGSTNYTVTVGGGGAGGSSGYGNRGASGSNSVFSSITSTGGGGGGSGSNAGLTGGSGGGGPQNGITPGSGTTSQGFAGGNGGSGGAAVSAGGGGGGAGSVGANFSSNNGGNGGNGVATSITGSSVTRAGGGGAGAGDGSGATGGTGQAGGGNGGNFYANPGTAATVNTGSGGGGGAYGGAAGAAGGSGIVIIRYPIN